MPFLTILTIGIALPVAGSLISIVFFPNWSFPHDPLHSALESLGGFIALALSGILLTEKTHQPEKVHYTWIACALISMGILDILHAMVFPGNLFVWLHSTAQFTGGLIFSLVWLPKKQNAALQSKSLPMNIFWGITTLGVYSIIFPESLPEMVTQGKFSPLARALNILGGIGFIMAACFFTRNFKINKERQDYLFAIHCFLFGAAGVLFELSHLWDAAWWWHLLRLMAYSAGLVLAIAAYRITYKKLQESEAQLRGIFNNSPSVIYLKDLQSRFLLVNKEFEKLVNLKNDDIKNKTAMDIFPEDIGRLHIENDKKVIQAEHPLESEEEAPHGDGYHQYLSVKFPIKDSAGKTIGICGISNDITERKKAEEKIKALSKFPDENPEPILRISSCGELLYANRASLTLLESWNVDVGQNVPLQWNKLVNEVISSMSNKAVEVMVNQQHYLMMIAYIEDGNYVNIYGANITESKHSNKRLKFYTDELERSNKDLEDFAYLASHDLQEPLRKIIMFGDRLICKSTKMDEIETDHVIRMQKAAERMKTFIEALLKYSKFSKVKKQNEIVDLELIVNVVKENIERQIRKCNATIHMKNLPTLEGDSNQLQVLFQNLISNSLKYCEESVSPIIHITGNQCGQTGVWHIELSDNGIGIEEKYFERIFKPFERLHGRHVFEGTGIGLAICKKIVERHHGSILLSSIPDKGTTFKISLPQKQPTLPT